MTTQMSPSIPEILRAKSQQTGELMKRMNQTSPRYPSPREPEPPAGEPLGKLAEFRQMAHSMNT
jgi:hypothetical protein